jgi:hypothetical protein
VEEPVKLIVPDMAGRVVETRMIEQLKLIKLE